MKNKVVLYIATHNITGKKYFGKTIKWFTENELQENYHGSGKYWLRHLKKHGDDVTMKVYGIYSLNEVKEIATNFSKEHDIVESSDWANLKEENGTDGGDNSEFIDYKKIHEKGCITRSTHEWKEKMKPIYAAVGKKSIQTQLNDIDENGLNGIDRRSLKISEVNTGNPNLIKATQESADKLRNDIDENGLNGLERRAKQKVQNMRNDVDESGLDAIQRQTKRMMIEIEKKKNILNEDGLNEFQIRALENAEKRRTTICENGKTIEENRNEKQKETLKKKSIKKYGLYRLNDSDKLYTRSELDNISQCLLRYYGRSLYTLGSGPTYAKTHGKEHLIGLHIVENVKGI